MSERFFQPLRSLPISPAKSFDPPSEAAERILGLDVGGANVKAATHDGHVASVPLPLWLDPDRLIDTLVSLAGSLPSCSAWAVTMTGEMADCFANRAEGVRQLVTRVHAAADRVGVPDLAFYQVDGDFVSASRALAQPLPLASANWHALGQWLSRQLTEPALLIDIGGTTTDIIPLEPAGSAVAASPGDQPARTPPHQRLSAQGVATRSRTDFDRLAASELVYLGGERTPVCALRDSLPFRGRQIEVMREVFATTDDCRLILRDIAERPDDRQTSDGRPRTIAAATDRLARMIGLDGSDLESGEALALARAVLRSASQRLIAAIARQPSHFSARWIVSGHTAGSFLADLQAAFPRTEIVHLAEVIGEPLCRAAPAIACAQLLLTQKFVPLE